MLDGTSRPTNPEYELDGIRTSGQGELRGSRLAGRNDPDPVNP